MNELYERARRAEDDYFRRRDAELIERAREARAQGASVEATPARSAEEQALVEALGIEEASVVAPLHAAGLSASNVSLLDWLPAIEVAWVDDVDMHEREELRRQYATDPASDGASLSLLTEWLFVRPPHEALLAARHALRRRLDALPEADRRLRIHAIVQRCETVGHASGGIFGLGTLSWDEQARIEDIKEALGDAPDPLTGPVEIPH